MGSVTLDLDALAQATIESQRANIEKLEAKVARLQKALDKQKEVNKEQAEKLKALSALSECVLQAAYVLDDWPAEDL